MNHKAIEVLVETLRHYHELTPFESDILETWDTVYLCPFDADKARQKLISNIANHPEVYAKVIAMPENARRPITQLTDEELKSNLNYQLDILVAEYSVGKMEGRRL